MTLTDVLREARKQIAGGSAIDAEKLLESCCHDIKLDDDLKALHEYATLCHDWGPTYAEEAALRRILELEESGPSRRDIAVRLADILQEKATNTSTREPILSEAVTLVTQALGYLDDADCVARANIIKQRGRLYLDLAKCGRSECVSLAGDDFEHYLRWLRESPSVPVHWNRDSMIATCQIQLAEVHVLARRRSAARKILEESIAILELTPIGEWATEHAYSLLESIGTDTSE